MQSPACPHCGAPAPGQFPPGMTMVQCPYCKQSYPAPQANMPPQYQQPPQQQAPQIVVLHTHSTYDNSYPIVTVNWTYWAIRGFVPLIIIASLGGFGAYHRHRHHGLGGGFGGWDGSTPFECGGNDDVSASNVTANFNAGTAITVGGNCHFTCMNCNITAPTAIEAAGNGSVTMVNGNIVGTDVLADASGNAHVNVSGNVTASGQVHQSGNAKVSAPRPAAAATPTGASATSHATTTATSHAASTNVPGAMINNNGGSHVGSAPPSQPTHGSTPNSAHNPFSAPH